VQLPAVDVDYRALARHSAGHLLRLGHRRIGFLVARKTGLGVVAGEASFLETCSAHRSAIIHPMVLTHDGSIRDVTALLRLAFSMAVRPTALIVETSNH